MGKLLSDSRFTEAVLKFLGNTGVCFESCIYISLHVARRAMAALSLPLKATAGFCGYTHFLSPDGLPKSVIVGVSQRLLPPKPTEKQKTKERQKHPYPLQTKEEKKERLVSSTRTPPSIQGWVQPPARPPTRLPTPPRRPGSRPRAPQGSRPPAPCEGGEGISTSTLAGGPPWLHRHRPGSHEGPCSWYTW